MCIFSFSLIPFNIYYLDELWVQKRKFIALLKNIDTVERSVFHLFFITKIFIYVIKKHYFHLYTDGDKSFHSISIFISKMYMSSFLSLLLKKRKDWQTDFIFCSRQINVLRRPLLFMLYLRTPFCPPCVD